MPLTRLSFSLLNISRLPWRPLLSTCKLDRGISTLSCTLSCFSIDKRNSAVPNESRWNSAAMSWKQNALLGNQFSTWNNERRLLQSRNTYIPLLQCNSQSTLSAKALVDASPSLLQPYLRLMRIDRPIGIWLVFLPCAWSISLAVPIGQLPDPTMLTLFALGSFFMRGAGCVINDMWDKDFDAKVARTKDRPLASGELTRFKALCFLSLPLSISLAILMSFNWNTILLGAFSMIPCIVYPLLKRVTYWPQAFLGITQNWGIMIAWSAINGCLDWPCLTLYLSGVLWTVTYDTIYSHQDKEDDISIGVKSTALRFGDSTKLWLTGFSSIVSAGLLSTGYLTDQTWPYYLGVAMFTTHLGHQIYSVNLNDPVNCGEMFRSNRNLGLIFWMMIIAANLVRDKEKKKTTDEEEDERQLLSAEDRFTVTVTPQTP